MYIYIWINTHTFTYIYIIYIYMCLHIHIHKATTLLRADGALVDVVISSVGPCQRAITELGSPIRMIYIYNMYMIYIYVIIQ